MKVAHPYDIIIKPILTEESTIQTESKNKYTFKVDPRANKVQIRDVIEKYFNVTVESVNTMNYLGKVGSGRNRGTPGRKSNWKKAIVTVRKGDTIDLI